MLPTRSLLYVKTDFLELEVVEAPLGLWNASVGGGTMPLGEGERYASGSKRARRSRRLISPSKGEKMSPIE